MRLTDEQRAAVAEPGHVCLVSCPGSGKTRVIVAKLLYCIECIRDTTRRIACITHTNAAADEVDTRLRETCFSDEDIYYEVATIHGFALQNILRPFHQLLPELRQGFTIFTPDMDAYSEKVRELVQRYDLRAFTSDEFERIQRGPDGNPSHLDTLPSDLQEEWCAWLDENAYVTLNEIVYHAGRLVSIYPHIASALASRFAWVLVDEFQDSSPGQILILKQIHAYGRTTFFCVGDPTNPSIVLLVRRPNSSSNSPNTSKPTRLIDSLETSVPRQTFVPAPNASAPRNHRCGRLANTPNAPSLLRITRLEALPKVSLRYFSRLCES